APLVRSTGATAPSISSISTSPNPPVNGQAFTITLSGSNFDGSNSTVFFSGPGCSSPCSITASGSGTQVSGRAILATGTFTVTLKNNTTGLTSNGVALSVSTGAVAPMVHNIVTSSNRPVNGQAFT